MPVTSEWYIEKKILLTRAIGDVTIEDLEESNRQGTELIDSGEDTVLAVVDLSQLKSFPKRLTEIQRLASLPRSPKLSWLILCGINDPIASFMATAFSQFSHIQYRTVKTLDEALTMARTLAELEPLPTPAAGDGEE